MRNIYLIFLVSIIMSCDGDELPGEHQDEAVPNILLIIADDLGKDMLEGFSEGTIKANTPELDKIRTGGLSFSNFWTYPSCTPTRSSIITGKYGYSTGVKWANDILDPAEKILQSCINDQNDIDYNTAIIGKWHLSGEAATVNPEDFGLDFYSGLLRGAVQNYYQWQLSSGNSSSLQTGYITEVLTDIAIEWVNDQDAPWFLWLAYNAPHTPFHVPPSEMHKQGDLPAYEEGMDALPYYLAAVEAMDFQISRLLESLSTEEREKTIIIFIGDNGSPVQVAQSPYSRNKSKGSLYQGGINVPMLISGIGVDRIGVDHSLVSCTDLFSTILDLTGTIDADRNDSKSFRHLLSQEGKHRDYVYSEMDNGSDDIWTIRNSDYKLIINSNGNAEMYNLIEDAYENNNLLDTGLDPDEEAAKQELETELSMIRN